MGIIDLSYLHEIILQLSYFNIVNIMDKFYTLGIIDLCYLYEIILPPFYFNIVNIMDKYYTLFGLSQIIKPRSSNHSLFII